MRIGIDARVLDRKMTGVGRYLKNLLDGIPEVDNKNEYCVFINDESLIDTNFYTRIPVKESWLPDKIFSAFWLNFYLPSEIKKYKLDVFFTCNILLPFINVGNTKKITVIHDIIHKVHKNFYPFSYRIYLDLMLPITFRNADIILSASEYSKNDIVRFFPDAESKLKVLYTSADKKFKKQELSDDEKDHILEKYGIRENFLLYVGVIEKRKNIDALFQIAERLNKDDISLPIVLIGRAGYGYDDIEERGKATNGKVIYINFVSEEDLPKLYNLAFLFLFPSFYEGFGIPPLEAMQSGTPVISSNKTSLPEVLGSGAIMISPDDVSGFVEEIKKLLSDKNYYEEYKQKGILQAQKFSFIKSAKQFVDSINSQL